MEKKDLMFPTIYNLKEFSESLLLSAYETIFEDCNNFYKLLRSALIEFSAA
jgi:hypothetical protein